MDLVSIDSPEELRAFAAENELRSDWHEPDEHGVDAFVVGNHLDNAFGTGLAVAQLEAGSAEMVVILKTAGSELGTHKVNLANLLAWACEAAPEEAGDMSRSDGLGAEVPA